MITPAFELTQDPDYLTLTIKVPYARVSEVDVYVEGDDFKFYSKPYFLRLSLPGRVVEDGRQSANYNADEGVFKIRLPKETPGQHFEGLDLLTSLLAPRGGKSCKPLVEEMGPSSEVSVEEEFDWQIEQTPYDDSPASMASCNYGFGNLRSGIFRRLQDELNDIIDLRDPDITLPSERTKRRLASEKAKFDPDHYLADLFEDDAILHLLTYQPWWVVYLEEASRLSLDSREKRVVFSETEREQLRLFTNKSYLLDKKAERLAFMGLIDLLLAYCYENRVTEGERNVESAWNIRKLSGTLSWFENYMSIKDVLVSFGRRVLCYPLFRHFSLVTKAIQDTCSLLKLGKAAVLKCLLDIHSIFQANDPAYILNDLYVTDYCIWIQKVKSKKVSSLSGCLQEPGISKEDLGFELEELEAAARLVQQEENQLSASATVPRQPAVLLTCDSSSSESSSETEDSSSDEEDTLSSVDPALEDSSASLQRDTAKLLIEDIGTSEKSDALVGEQECSPQTTPVPLQVEGITQETTPATIAFSKHLSEHVAANANSQDVTGANCTIQPTGNIPVMGTAREFLEVTPRPNPLLIVAQADHDKPMLEEI
ncbi:protein SHQ1 homolog [Pelodytes ibericus]